MEQKKNEKIENIRAFAILLVVVGHSIIMYKGKMPQFKTQVPFYHVKEIMKFINGVEMPIFMSVSGFVFWYSMQKNVKASKFLLNKIRRLLIPYLCVACLWVIPTRMLAKVVKGNYFKLVFEKIILIKDTGHLWYLLCLFMIFIFMYAIIRYRKVLSTEGEKTSIDFMFLILLFLLSVMSKIELDMELVVFQRMLIYPFWFFLGYIINEYGLFEIKTEGKGHIAKKVIFLMAFVIVLGLYYSIKSRFTYYFVALLGVFAIYSIMPKQSNKFVRLISKNSYGIYLFHSPMVWLMATYFKPAVTHPYLTATINIVGLGGIALVMTCLLRKTPLRFIIGE